MALDLDYEKIFGDTPSRGSGVVRFSDVVQPGTPPAQQESEGSGLLGNLVRGIVTPLTVIDTPRRALISGVREAIDAFDGNPETDASFTDFKDQTLDPTYGVGSAFPDPTGNKWVDRLIGFAGDVALDPITYLGFGAGKAATLTGRAAYATNLLRAAKATDRLEEATPIIQRLSSGGVNALDASQRRVFDDIVRAGREAGVDAGSEIGEAGLRMRVPFSNIESAPIPFTQGLADRSGRALSNVRSGLSRSTVGTNMRRRLSPQETVELFDTMVRGGDPQLLLRQLSDFSANTRRVATEGIQESRLLLAAEQIRRQGKREGVSGEQLTREITSGEPVSQTGRAGQDFLLKEGKALGDVLPEFGLREGGTYVPRVLTRVGRELRKGDLGGELDATMGFVDDLGGESITKTRQINAGDKLVRGDRVEVLKGNDPFAYNEAMNRLYPELGGGIKFVEEDGYELLNSWARDASSAYGRARYADELLELGDATPASAVLREQELSRRFADEGAESAQGRVDDLVAARQARLDEANAKVRDARANVSARIDEQVSLGEGAVSKLRAREAAAIRKADRRVAELDDEIAKLDRQIGTLQDVQKAGVRRQLKERSRRRGRLLAERARAVGALENLKQSVDESLMNRFVYPRIDRQLRDLDVRAQDVARRSAGVDEALSAGNVTADEAAFLRDVYRRELNDIDDARALVGDVDADPVLQGFVNDAANRVSGSRQTARLERADEALRSLGRGSSGIVPDQNIADELEYLAGRRDAALQTRAGADADPAVVSARRQAEEFGAQADARQVETDLIRSRDPDALARNPRTSSAVDRQRSAESKATAARKSVREAQREGFVTNLDGVETTASIRRDLDRLPEGNSRLGREARALIDDVPESQLLTGDEKYLQDLRKRAMSDEHAAVAHALMLDVYRLELRFAVEGGEAKRFGQFFESLGRNTKNSVQLRTRMMSQLEDGWRQIEGTGVAVPEEIYVMRQRLMKLNDPKEFSGFLKAWEGYTRIFKAYVTATPRFHIRNGMSAAFMNYSDGVTTANMARGVRVWKKYLNVGRDGLDAQEQKIVDAVLGSGAGQYAPTELGYTSPKGTGWSRRAGRNVEGAVRAGVAVATVEAGGSLEEAVARITRLHFNYSQISSFDRVARQVFPFWTFMSRNLPLQVSQMWTKPQAYARFNTVVRNIRTDDEETGTVPDYFLEGGGFRLPGALAFLGGGQYARPDIGFSRLEEDVDRLADPIRFLADANPVIKGLVEGFADKQLYKDIPLDDESYVPLAGWQKALAPVLLAMGQAEQQADGTVVVTPKTEYLVDQFVPVGSLFNRYAGEGSRNEGNAFRNLYSALGVPSLVSGGGYVRELTPEKQAAAERRKRIQEREAIRKLEEIAKAS